MKPVQLLAACGLLIAASVHAQVYKCKDSGGQTLLSGQPCASGELVQGKRTAEETLQDDVRALEANRQKHERRANEADKDATPKQSPGTQVYAQGAQPSLRDSDDCRLAQRDLDFARSSIARNEAEKRDQVNVATAKTNAACGSNTELLQPPAKIVQPIVAPNAPTTITNCNTNYCYDSQGGVYRKSSNPNMMTGPDGRVCHRAGNVLNC